MAIPGWGKWLGAAGIVMVLLVLALAFFPLGLLKDVAESRLSARFGAPVTIRELRRLDPFSLHPRVRIAGVRIGQPGWAGRGDFASVDQAIVRIPVLPLLRGAFLPESIDVRGVVLNLVRDAGGRANWEGRSAKGKRKPTRIEHLTIVDGRLRLRDDKRRITLDARMDADSARGVTVVGPGTHRGQPMRFSARAGAVEGAAADAPWPVRLSLVSPLLRLDAQGTTDRPLDIDGFDATITASGPDIDYLDDVIEAGLPGTQEFTLKAVVRHDNPDWNVKAITARIGRSDMTGAVTVSKRDGRTNLKGHLDAGALDFDDLASDAQLAAAVAKRRANGPRVIPDTQIHFEKLGKLDGTLRVSARRLLIGRDSIFQGFAGTVTMDRRILTLSPLTIQLKRGAMAGSVAVDHRAGDPKLRVDMRMRGGRLSDLLGASRDIDGPVEARLLLAGSGRTVRAALAGASGRAALVMRGGTMRKQLAIFASGDILDSIGTIIGGNKTARVPVNCLVANFAARGGALTPSALLLDTPIGRADGTGGASLATERLALAFTGRSKRPDPIQLAAKVRVQGSFIAPIVSLTNAQGQTPRKKGLVGKIGGFLGSVRTKRDEGRGLPIPPANCGAVTAAALR